jgi:antitoxin StbD
MSLLRESRSYSAAKQHAAQLPHHPISSKISSNFISKYQAIMQALLTPLTVGISEFKKNPGASLRKAKGAPIAVLSHNAPSFYVLQPEVMQGFANALAEKDFTALVQARRASAAQGNSIEVSIDDL